MTTKSQCKPIRQGTEKKCSNPTHRPPLISYGTKERAILQYLKKIKGTRFSVRGYSRTFNVAKTTIYDQLKKLEKNGLVNKISYGNYVITKKGETILEVSDGVSDSSVEGVGRGREQAIKREQISCHFVTFKLQRTTKTFNHDLLIKLNPIDIKTYHLPNLPITNVYLDNATIIIKPKQILIRVNEIVTNDIDELYFKAFEVALKHIDSLERIGLRGDSIILDQGHYAKVKTIFSEIISKIDNRYFLDLGNGKKLWIDCSLGKIEDETNDPIKRERLDTFLRDALNSESLISDVDKMKEVLGTLIKLKIMDNDNLIKRNNDLGLKDYNYFG